MGNAGAYVFIAFICILIIGGVIYTFWNKIKPFFEFGQTAKTVGESIKDHEENGTPLYTFEWNHP